MVTWKFACLVVGLIIWISVVETWVVFKSLGAVVVRMDSGGG